ncbi:MAG TPA: hypothetical protein VLV82_07880, partial [Candidatus Angelobacter sp.]|nr:hypothetical protein [Candidatus Angelobacter sp.]
TEQLRKFLDRHRDRISQLGGLTLIDDDPDYLSVAPDCTFRVRSRYEDPDTGEWVSETEIVETPSELVELYNPAEIFQAFAEAAREAAGFGEEPTATDELLGAAGIAPDETFQAGDEGYAGAADEWAAAQPPVLEADDEESAAHAMYDLALDFQERSQQNEARLIEQFEDAVAKLSGRLGDLIIVDDDDERLVLGQSGRFRAEVLPEDGDGEWRELTVPDDIVEYYDPTDVFGDLADALAEGFPSLAPGLADEDEAGAEGDEDEDDEDADTSANGQRP